LPVRLRSEIERKFKNQEFTCEKELTMSIISGKYKVVIIWHLGNEGPRRFGQLFRLFNGISNRILTKQLRDLEQDGIIARHVYAVAPPKVGVLSYRAGKYPAAHCQRNLPLGERKHAVLL
jgi:DNA-binding HxlR family transcriptional regulator